MEWTRSETFDNRHVLESYCQDDVTVLRHACRVFRREFMQIGHIDFFVESIALEFACNKVLRKRFLKPDTIGLIPTGGYTCNNRYRKKALMWLLHMEETGGVQIMHCRNGREYRLPELPRFSVVVYCPQTNTIYDFFGCFWHGHTCQPFRDVATLSGDTLAEGYERTISRLEQITRAGYQVKVQWECEFEEKPDLHTHPVVRQSPLCTRDALYGGRTEAMRLHYKVRENETIQYVDVMSLYPYICKYFKFPTGHPFIHVGDACKDKEACLRMDRLIKCTIVPPQKLYHQVLPDRCNNKLMFCLCGTCVQTCCTGECMHTTDEERALTGTWLMDEVRLAVERGYKILEIYEVYEYQVTQYSPETGDGGLFVDYINTFLKLKSEASGYPGWVRSPPDEELYVESFWQNEAIRLDRESMKSNATKRGLAKLCLNSMWGKLTERNDRTQTKVISEPKDLYSFLATPGVEVTNLAFASYDVVLISWKHAAEEHVPNLLHTNEFHGAYFTAGARIHLYRYLDRLGERAIYCDTDSVIYFSPETNLI